MSVPTQTPVTLVNTFKTDPARHEELVALLTANTETVIKTLPGWIRTNIIAGLDRQSVVIYSQWESPESIEAMRSEPRMLPYIEKVRALASFESIAGEIVLAEARQGAGKTTRLSSVA